MSLGIQTAWLFLLAIPVACAAWTVTHEEVFREPREFAVRMSRNGRRLGTRKFFYLFTCEYCFSHYVALLALWMTGFRLLLDGWRGFILAWFAVVWVANQYMSIYGHLKVATRNERAELQIREDVLEEAADGVITPPS